MTYMRRRVANAMRQHMPPPVPREMQAGDIYAPAEPVEVPITAEVRQVTCPHCGRTMKAHGAHFHIRACKG